jgi:hypothetical protein
MFPRYASTLSLAFITLTLFYLLYGHSAELSLSTKPELHDVVVHTDHYVPPEPITLTLVMMGAGAAREGLTTIKSALMHSSRPLDIHIICDAAAIPIVESRLTLVQRPYYPLSVTFHVITLDSVRERLQRAGVGSNWSYLTKTLMQEILIGVEKTIFVDTDMIFVGAQSPLPSVTSLVLTLI